MAITCKWENPLAKATNEQGQKVTFYGGGNVLACICYENKVLENFIVDKKHFKACEYKGTEYRNIRVYMDRGIEAKNLIDCLLLGKFDFRVVFRKEKINHEKN